MALRILPRAALVAVMATGGAASLTAQTKIPPALDCGHGVLVRLSATTAAQGSLLEAEVRTTKPLEGLTGDWAGHELYFWQEPTRRNVEHALVGVDLEHEPGHSDLRLTIELAGGEKTACHVAVTVKAGKFAVEKLSVAKEYVEPSAAEIERSNQERQRLREIFATATPGRLWQGKFRLPLEGAGNAKNFGRRRVLNGQPGSPHSGVDFPATAGTPVHAAQSGCVVLAEELFFSGNTVVIDHGLGLYTFYGHMESLAVRAGDEVKVGGVLGKVGATGRVTGPHLHWGLTVNQARVNPLQILSLPTN